MSDPSRDDVPPPLVVEAFSAAALTALEELVQVSAALDDAPQPPRTPDENWLLAVVELLRPRPGRLTLLVPAAAAADLARRYLPPGAPLSDALVDDVVGEFANVIAGQAKTALQGTPYHYALSLPRVQRVRAAELPPAAGSFALRFESGRLCAHLELPPCAGA